MGAFGAYEATLWLATGLTLATAAMRTALPLRAASVAGNVVLLMVGFAVQNHLLVATHLAILPLNLYRSVQLYGLVRGLRRARLAGFDADWLMPLIRSRSYEHDEYIFRKGDTPDNLYYLASGRIMLVEAGIILDEGEIFGEIAFLTDSHQRTLSARCVGPCRIMAIDEDSFMRLYYQNPAFGFYIVRLISRRLLDGATRHPEAYIPLPPDGRTAP